MKTFKKLTALLLGLFIIYGCDQYINNAEAPDNIVDGEKLTQEGQIGFLVTGVLQRNSTASPYMAGLGDLLSDQMIFNSDVPQATFPSFRDIENGNIIITNADVTGAYNAIHQLRYFADSLVDRSNLITFANENTKKLAYYTGYLYGGIARLYLGIYWGDLDTQQYGATINNSPFIPQNQILDQAVETLKKAIPYAANAFDAKVVNSYIAKTYLAKLDYANVATFAAQGLQKGDAPLLALKNDISTLWHWGFAGAGRIQLIVNDRFNNYVKEDPNEAIERVLILPVRGRSGRTYYYQNKYPLRSSSFVMITWQENSLMLAEAALRGAGSANALTLVNDVRTSRKLTPVTSVDLELIYKERDKELFVQGARMMDQLRYNRWYAPAGHMPAGKSKFLPLPLREKDPNPNY